MVFWFHCSLKYIKISLGTHNLCQLLESLISSELVQNLKSFVCENSFLLRSIANDHGKLIKSLKTRIMELEDEKVRYSKSSSGI